MNENIEKYFYVYVLNLKMKINAYHVLFRFKLKDGNQNTHSKSRKLTLFSNCLKGDVASQGNVYFMYRSKLP